MTQRIKALPADKLYYECDVSQFSFETTETLPIDQASIGQDRALDAIKFGVNIQKQGYNLYVMGPTGAGKHTLVHEVLHQSAPQKKTSSDWCYLNNFQQNHEPIAICLPAGTGKQLKRDLQELTTRFSQTIPTAFDTENYDKQLLTINHDYQIREEAEFNELEQNAKKVNIAFIQTDSEFSFAPLQNDEPIKPADYDKLIEKEKENIQQNISTLQHQLQGILQHLPKWQQESRDKVTELNEKIANKAINYWVHELKHKYKSHKKVIKHLQAIQEDVINNVEVFLPQHNQDDNDDRNPVDLKIFLTRYHLNLIVDHKENDPAPIIYESNPTQENLIGKIDSISQYGTLTSDFSLIKAGALHKANGGYLVLDAYKVLDQPNAWDALKRSISSKEVVIEPSAQALLQSTITLKPAPIPLDVKIILLGDYNLYLTLYDHDPEFDNLFKVVADLEDSIKKTPQSIAQYVHLIASIIAKQELRTFDKLAVARAIEHSSRLCDNSEKLATHNGELRDLLTEADYWAGQNDRKIATKEDVQTAISQQHYRFSRIEHEVQESIIRGTTLIATDGEVIGQINGLTVAHLGFFSFGQPSRITALARLGDGKVIDIESEANLSGDIHTKGVLILTNFFKNRYGKMKSLSFTASLTFEQSYGEIDGDSASTAELVAIMSAIAEIPIKQSIAITGAINQFGTIQAIGGINEKIEGFYDICAQRGLNGEQGVIIPSANIHHLMLRQDVVDASKAGKFNIYPVDNIDDAIEILTDTKAGERNENGVYDPNFFNGKVESQLLKFYKLADEEGEEENHEDHHRKKHHLEKEHRDPEKD